MEPHDGTGVDTSDWAQWLTAKETVRYLLAVYSLGISSKTVKRWVVHAELPIVWREQKTPNGFRYMFDRSSIDGYVPQLQKDLAEIEEARKKRTGVDMSTPVRTGPDMSGHVQKAELSARDDVIDILKAENKRAVSQLRIKDQQIERRDRQYRELNETVNKLTGTVSQVTHLASGLRRELEENRRLLALNVGERPDMPAPEPTSEEGVEGTGDRED